MRQIAKEGRGEGWFALVLQAKGVGCGERKAREEVGGKKKKDKEKLNFCSCRNSIVVVVEKKQM